MNSRYANDLEREWAEDYRQGKDSASRHINQMEAIGDEIYVSWHVEASLNHAQAKTEEETMEHNKAFWLGKARIYRAKLATL